MSQADSDRYARDRERIRARQAGYLQKNGNKWQKDRKARHEASAILQTKRAWKLMQRRCYDQKCDKFRYYGGRGIAVYQPWRESFELFLAYIGPRPSLKHSLDRFPNNDGNYEPENVRWATHSQQMLNRRLPERLKPTCICGVCAKCKQRAAVKRYRDRKKAENV